MVEEHPAYQGIDPHQAHAFKLLLQLHTPLVLPRIVPRLDTLLQEAASRRALDWSVAHPLPLVFDQQQGAFRASQMIFGVTPRFGLEAHGVGLVSHLYKLPLLAARNVRAPLRIDGGDWAPKLTQHKGRLCPYLIFYAEGDAQACLDLLGEIPHIGIGYSRGQGAVTATTFEPDTQRRWCQRSWRDQAMHAGMPYTPQADYLRLTPKGKDEPVYRPPRILREVLA
ncbi:hypothetical protein ELY33_12295 [Vreelandella andesensis]|uniref:Uncharacterized protein n=1 Tax=Vreelandella andesensis TaxID=447567 RepID=A0A433KJ42_9GAMM|nr:hypothetical protein [Halomonas andesensis]RUR29718.1 hypothetical protein ELY33_12295 [Halomonas andesensis]